MRLARSAAVNIGSVASAALAGAFAIAVMARTLDVRDFGRVALMLTAANAIAVFDGLRPVIVYEVSMGRRAWSTTYVAARCISAASAVIVGTLAIGTTVFVPALGFSFIEALMAGLLVLAFFSAMFFWSFLDADGDTAFSGGVRGLAWVALYAVFVLLAVLRAPFVVYLAAISAMNLALAVCYRRRLRTRHPLPQARLIDGRGVAGQLLRPALQNITTNVGAVTISVSDRLVIGAVLGSAAAGLYSGPSEFATKPTAFLRAITLVLYPAAAQRAVQQGAIDVAWRRITMLSLLVSISGTAVVILERQLIVGWLLGPQFVQSADVFGVLCAALTLSVGGYAAVVYLNAHGDFSTQRTLYAAAAVFMVLGSIVVAPRWGILGVAWTYLAARSVDLMMCLIVGRAIGEKCNWHMLALFVAAALTYGLAWHEHEWATACSVLATWVAGSVLLPANRNFNRGTA